MAQTSGQAITGLPDVPLTALDAERIDELVLYVSHTIINADEPALVWGALIVSLLDTAADHCPMDDEARMPLSLASVGMGAKNLDAFTMGIGGYVHVLGQRGHRQNLVEIAALADTIKGGAEMMIPHLPPSR